MLFPIIRQLAGATTPPEFFCGSLRNPISAMMTIAQRASAAFMMIGPRVCRTAFEQREVCRPENACPYALRRLCDRIVALLNVHTGKVRGRPASGGPAIASVAPAIHVDRSDISISHFCVSGDLAPRGLDDRCGYSVRTAAVDLADSGLPFL